MGIEYWIRRSESPEDLFHNNMNILNTTESYTLKWLLG